jgi:hypothetical protein
MNNTGKLARFFCFLLLTCWALPSFSQGWVNPEHKGKRYPGFKKGWYAGADAGVTLFYGDVSLYNVFPKIKDFKKSFGNGYSFYGGKKFRFGMTAEAQVFKGNLTGEKIADKLYPRYFRADVLDYSISFKYNLSQELFRASQQRKFFNRLTLFATLGVGQTFFRSRLYKLAVNNQWYLEKANGYSSTGIDSASGTSGGGLVTQKKGMISAITLPIGGKLNFKLNSKTDIVFDLRYVTVFSDKVDGWERSWSHSDKYMYLGLGLVYNFNDGDEAEDVPKNQRFMKHDDAASTSGADNETVAPSKKPRKGLFRRNSKKDDKDLQIKLMLYELQLKLFELQYGISSD